MGEFGGESRIIPLEWFSGGNDGYSEFVIKYLQRSKRYLALEAWEFKEVSLGRRISRGEAIKLYLEWRRNVLNESDMKNVELLELRVIAK